MLLRHKEARVGLTTTQLPVETINALVGKSDLDLDLQTEFTNPLK